MRETAHGGVFIDFRCKKLPVDVMDIAKTAGVYVVRDSDTNVLCGEYGRAYYKNGKWMMVYDDRLPEEKARYVLAHELGHVFLGHPEVRRKFMLKGKYKSQVSEKQADAFAERLLCPACVIWAMELNSPEAIASFCEVDIDMAQRRHARMEILRKRGKFLTDPDERALFNMYLPYINHIRSSKGLPLMERCNID